MAREDLILRIKAADRAVAIERVRAREVGRRPLATIHRNRAWLVPLSGFLAGCMAGSSTGKVGISALFSSALAAIRLQPMVTGILNRI